MISYTVKIIAILVLAVIALLVVKAGFIPGRLSYNIFSCTPAGTGSGYWAGTARGAGLNPSKLKSCNSSNGQVWIYDGKNTCVGAGAYNKACPDNISCAGGAKYGTGAKQMTGVKAAVANGGINGTCPAMS